MFALKPRLEIAFRVLLTAMILFNALATSSTIAKAEQQSLFKSDDRTTLQETRSAYLPERLGLGVDDNSNTSSSATQVNKALRAENDSSIMFIENIGQFDPRAQFVVKGSRANLYLTQDAVWFTIIEKPKKDNPREDGFIGDKSNRKIKGVNLKVIFPGSNPNAKVEPFNKLEPKLSYFLGSTATKHFTNVPVWGGVRYVDLYPGVDLELTTENGELVWVVVVKDSSKLSSSENYISQHGLSLRITGQRKLKMSGNKANIESELGNFIFPRISIEGSINEKDFSKTPRTSDNQLYLIYPKDLSLSSNTEGVGVFISYTQSQPEQSGSTPLQTESSNLLVAKLLGGSDYEAAWGQAAGPDGSFFVTGLTESADFPDVAGYSEYLSGTGDAFLVKINPDGDLDYATYIGGSDVEDGYGVAVNQVGEVYLNGFTWSSDFPTTPDAVSTTPSGSFLLKLSSDGGQLLYSSYIGDNNTRLIGLAIDDFEDVYMLDGGYSHGTAYKLSIGSAEYEYVHSLGSGNWWGIDIDGNGLAYFAGATTTTPRNVLVAALSATGDPMYSFPFGGNNSDRGWSVAVDSDGYAYITGDTDSTNFPVLGDPITSAAPQDAFVTIVSPTGSIVYSSYLNLNGSESGGAIAVDHQDTVYVVGTTDSIEFPLTAGAIWNPGENGYWYAFVVKLKTLVARTSYQIEYATPIGGSDWDFTYSFTGTVDEFGHVYVTGETESPDFIGTEGVAEGDTQAFAVKVSTEAVGAIPDVFIPSTHNAGDNKTTIQGSAESDSNISSLSCDTQETCGDPINTHTGIFSFTLADLSFPTSAGDLVFQRSYNTGALDTSGTLGYGWTHNHEAKLILPTDPGGMEEYILFQSVLGNQFQFKIEANGTFTPGPGVIASLTKSVSAPIIYTLTDSQQDVFQFDENGRLILRRDTQGREFDYEYNAQEQLTKVSADNGARFIQISYDAQGRIDLVGNHANQEVTYGYDASGNLASAIDVLGQTWTYLYDSGHRMTQANDPAGKETVRTEYDAQGRANNQYDGEGNLIVSITYNIDGSTVVYDALGNTEEHQYDEHSIAVQTVDGVGRTETKEFNSNLRPTSITNDADQTLTMEWSADGVNLLSKTDPAGNQTSYDYDSLNNLLSATDPLGNTTNYTYNGKLLTGSTDALGGITAYTYTPEGWLQSVTDTAGRETSYTYDSFGQRTSMTDPSNNIWTYTYDSLGRLIDTTDPRGRVTHNEYNAAGKLIRVTQNYDPARPQNDQNLYNIVTEYTYDVRGNQIAVTDTYDRTTQYVYDDADRLLQTIDPAGNTTTNVYDAAGRLISTTDPRLNTTTYEYDTSGRLIKTINALGYHSGITTFDVPTNTSTVTDLLSRQTVFHYDDLGRVVQVVDPLGNSTATTYDENGNVKTRTDQLNRTTTYEYDELNRLVRTIDPNNGVTETVYNAAGYRTATIDPLLHQTTYTYDSVGRLVATTDPLGRVTQTVYDTYGRRSATIDAAGRETTYAYDLLDRVIAVTDPAGNTTSTTYDALGNVLTRTDANGNATTTTYDVLYRPHIITDANGNSITNTYDAASNLLSVTDALGNTTTYAYDALNRRVSVTDPLNHTTYTSYDSLGNLLQTTDANGVITRYEYDALNRQTAVILNYQSGVQADAQTNVRYEFEYNEVGNRVSVKDPNGNVTTYGYDALNRVTSKSDPLTNTWSYTYDLAGNRTSATDAKNQTIQYTYDAAGQLTGINYPGTEPDVTFTYTLTGQRLSMTDGLGTTTWTYDTLNRPASVTDALGNTISYDYDAVGNRTELIYPDGKIVTYAYDDANQLTDVTDWENQNTGYVYDDAGRLTSVSLPNGVTSQYTFDNAGRLTALQHNLGTSPLAAYSYTYDPAGNRTQAIEELLNPPQLALVNPDSIPNIGGQDFANIDLSGENTFVSYNVPDLQTQTDTSVSLSRSSNFIAPQQLEFGRLPLNFIANMGQFDKDVKFQTNALGGSIYFTQSEVMLALMDKKAKSKVKEEETSTPSVDNSKVVRIEYKGADKKAVVEGLELLPGVANFMLGSETQAWVTNAPMHAGIVYRELYPGVDLRYEGTGHSLKSTFTVAAGADPTAIQWRYKDAGSVVLDGEGNLLITLPAKKAEQTDTTLIEHTPVAWQEVDGQRLDVAVQYVLAQNGEISFVFPEGYDPSLVLTIDPVLAYSTYLGDIGTDVGTAITTDSSGNVYVTGYSWCGNFPTVDPITGVTSTNGEVIISKISADGSTLLYSTCVGGSGDDFGRSITLDTQGRIVLTGETDSTNFPIVGGIGTYGGGSCSSEAPCQDMFILALNSDGSAIRYSTYLGGNGREEVGGIAVDSNGKIIVVGSTASTNFPAVNAYDSTFAGGTCPNYWPCYDATVTKIDPELSGSNSILYSTYLGGIDHDKAYGVVLDENNIVYLAGYSDSDGYPVRNALQPSRRGSVDIIVSQINPSLNGDASLLYSTYLGGTDTENGYAVARDVNGNLYITGRTSSPRLPLRDPLQYESHAGSTCNGTTCYEAFVTKLNIAANTIVYSTYLGGSHNDEGFGIAVDTYGRAYVTGFTRSSDFPTFDAIQSVKGGDGCSSTPCRDAFLSVLEPDGQSFAYSTFLGGDQDDTANGITVDDSNNVYLIGETYSINFPTTPGAYDVVNTETNKRDAFITKIGALGTPPSQSFLHLDVPVATGNDDAEETNSSGNVTLDSSDIELGRDSSEQTVGIRFDGVNIPQGVIIQNAWIQFRVDEATSEATSLTIRAEASDNAPAFITTPLNISTRPKTALSVAWSPAAWDTVDEAGPDQRTPDLASLVQEIVNRPGWVEGNAINFIITGSGKRVADSFEEDMHGAAYLHIEYVESTDPPAPSSGTILTFQPDGANGMDTYLLSSSANTNYGTSGDMGVGENNNSTNKYARSLIKFDLSSIPANVTIVSATLSLWTSIDVSSNDSTVRVYRLKVPFHETQATWNIASTGMNWQTPGASGANDRESVDIGSVQILANEPLNTAKQIQLSPEKVQELVNGGFANNGFILVTDAELNDRFDYKTSDTSTAGRRPKLVIEYIETTEPPATPTELTIDYTYDALHRLTSATYSDGRSFGYTYDAAGNVLELQQNLGPGTVTTTYAYNTANELVTAQVDNTTWNYIYDANGSLTEVLPNGNPASGAKRYTYNAAGNLVQVEVHNGTSWNAQAEMDYNGLGQRLSMDAAGVIAHYVMDGNRPLTSDSAGNTTFFLYGLGPIGEKTTDWNFSLPDGTNTPRQLADINGDITLSARYTPWGNSLELHGTGNFTFGYLGGVLDATTGLLYVGNGQYYDPATGRFLTRGVNPDAPNPYVPWNPIGAIIGPLALFSLVARRRKSTANPYLLMLLMLVVLPLSVAMACNDGTSTPTPTPVEQPPVVVTPGPGNDSGGVVSTPEPSSTPPAVPCPEPKNWLPELFQITHYVIVLENDPYFGSSYDANIPIWENNQVVYHQHNLAFIVGDAAKDVNWSVYVQGSGKTNDGRYIQTDLDPNHIPSGYNAVYQYVNQPQPKCGTYLKEDETIAVSIGTLNSPGFECGAKYYIEGHGEKIYTITDSGTFPNARQFDVYAGEQTHDAFYAKYPDTGAFRRVAKARQ